MLDHLANPFPPDGSKAHKLLGLLLKGEKMDTVRCMMELNLQTPNARVSEMRKLGWPIRSVKFPHPTLDGEHIVQYSFAQPFLRWYLVEHDGKKHPSEYPHNDGRGKFK